MGNNRIVANAAGTVVQRNSYYPFGMSYGEESDVEQGKQPYKYNGKELDKMHGLNQYDSDARYYDPGMIRTPTPDPHAENYYSWSPYAWVANNPMRLVDPDGRSYTDYVDNDGVRQVKTNDATPDRIETALPEVSVVGQAIQKPGNGVVAVGVNITGETQAVGSVAATPVNVVYITKGDDAGKVIVLAGGEYGKGSISISGSLNMTLYSYAGDIKDFDATTFEGESDVSGISADFGLSLGSSVSKATDPDGGILRGRSISLGIGASATLGDIFSRKSFSKPYKK